jgi:S1-C subfamily serine protease
MNKNLQYALWAILIGIGFMVGVSWKNTDESINKEKANSTSHLNELPNDLKPDELATIKLFEEACPSVAFITTTSYRQNIFTMDITEVPKGTGTGFVWDKEGHIVTNYHVIQGADKFLVTLTHNEEPVPAELVGAAPDKDLAVIKIKQSKSNLRPVPIGVSENLLVGQSVYAIGNPFGLDYSLTTGIISALGREIKGTDGTPIKDVIQTDAAINPGNSGGPLLNSSGQLIGVNTAIYSPSGAYAGIGFSIPVDVVKWVVPELILHGKIKRPSLGLASIASPRVVNRLGYQGILIMELINGGAADKAGLRPTTTRGFNDVVVGDIIVAIDDKPIKAYGDMILALEKYNSGDKVILTIIRDNKERKMPLVLDEAR